MNNNQVVVAVEAESGLATRAAVVPFPAPVETLVGAQLQRQREGRLRIIGDARAGSIVTVTRARVPERRSESGRVTAGVERIVDVKFAGVNRESSRMKRCRVSFGLCNELW
ncbi:hypothetical protein Csa_005460 [Cucumis sativus]|nr:hypothetical protein Csa_005460 [Cucumis sativus]